MSEAFASSRLQATKGGFQVIAPCRGDMLSGTLHRAYDDRRTVPDEMLALLAQLDRVETKRW